MSKATKTFFEKIGKNPNMQFPDLIDIFEYKTEYAVPRKEWLKWIVFKEGGVERAIKRFNSSTMPAQQDL